jgi:hypothetical protein
MPGTPRAPGALTGPSIGRSSPLVRRIGPAAPPDLPPRPGHDVLRAQRPVARRVPLLGKLGVTRGQRVGDRDPLACTERALPSVPRSLVDFALPLVIRALRALPPHLAVGARHDLVRCQLSIAGRVPLGRDLRKACSQRVLWDHAAVDAERTAPAPDTRRNDCAPLVLRACSALPPHHLLAAGNDVVRRQRSIPGRVPFRCKLGKTPCQRVGDRNLLPGAIGAAVTSAACVHRGLPFVVGAERALPPHPAMRSSRDLLGAQAAVPRGMPLGRGGRVERGHRVGGRHLLVRTEGAPTPLEGSPISGRKVVVSHLFY